MRMGEPTAYLELARHKELRVEDEEQLVEEVEEKGLHVVALGLERPRQRLVHRDGWSGRGREREDNDFVSD